MSIEVSPSTQSVNGSLLMVTCDGQPPASIILSDVRTLPRVATLQQNAPSIVIIRDGTSGIAEGHSNVKLAVETFASVRPLSIAIAKMENKGNRTQDFARSFPDAVRAAAKSTIAD